MRPTQTVWLVLAALSGAGSGCGNPPVEAADAAPEMAHSPPKSPERIAPAAGRTCAEPAGSATRPLSDVHYASAVQALLGDLAIVAEPLPAAPPGFTSGRPTTERLIEVAFRNAEVLSAAFVNSQENPCAGTPSFACAAKFINDFGREAFRRPLDEEERLAWLAVFEREGGRTDFRTGLREVVRGLLLAPEFLFHVERGTPGTSHLERKLTPHELANRLSFTLHAAPPDAALAKAADTGALEDPGEVARQVERLLTRPLARQGVRAFYGAWFRLHNAANNLKDADRYPHWNNRIAEEAIEESLAFAEKNFFEHDGDVAHLLTDRHAQLTPDIAKLYGLNGQHQTTELPPAERAGILTRAAFLAATSGPRYGSISYRGALLLNDLLCIEVPLAPANVDVVPPLPEEGLSRRQRLEKIVGSSTNCQDCHDLIDPPGVAFGHYDAVGAFQATEDGLAIDAHARLEAASEQSERISAEWSDAVEFSHVAAGLPEVRTCMSRHLWQHIVGRVPDASQDACMLERLRSAALRTDGHLRPLLEATLAEPLFAKFSGEAFPEDFDEVPAPSFTNAAQPSERAALHAAWQFRRQAEAFPLPVRGLFLEWSENFEDVARRLHSSRLDVR